MKRIMYAFLGIMFFMFVGIFCCCNDTFADNDLIKNAWIKGNDGIDSDGGTTFHIGMKFKGDCSGNVCEQTGKFRCTSPGKAYTTCIDNSKTKVQFSKNEGQWTYYKVTLYPCSSSQQTISGYIKKKNKYTLTVKERNIYNDGSLGSYVATTSYGWKVASRHVKDGYKFIGWNYSNDKTVMTSGDRLSKSSTDVSKGCKDSNHNFCNYSGSKADTKAGGHDVYTKVLVNLNQNRTVYAYFAKIYKLSIKIGSGSTATVTRTSTDYGPSTGRINNSNNIYKGDILNICVGVKNGYEKPVLKIKSGSGSYETKSLTGGCYVYTVSDDTYIQTSASQKVEKIKGFMGLSRVANALVNSDNEDTGWVQDDAEVRNYVVENCDPENGCPVVIAHHLKRMSGSGVPDSVLFDDSERSLSVYKDQGVAEGVPCYKSNSFCEVGEDNGQPGDLSSETNKKDITVRRMMYILKPGQKVCETMKFTPFSGKSDTASLTVCAYAVGSASTGLRMEIQNDSVPKYGFYTEGPVYAKPGDRIYFRAIYNPKAQYAYPLVPEGARINGSEDVHLNPDGPVIRHLGADWAGVYSMFNRYRCPPHTPPISKDIEPSCALKSWKNGFSMQISDDNFETTKIFHNTNPFSKEKYDAPYLDYIYSLGGNDRDDEKIEDYVYDGTNNPASGGVAEGDVGKTIIGRSLTNLEGSKAETTPSKVTFKMEGGYNIGDVETASVKSNDVMAIIPYNFELQTNISNEETVVYAGESSSVGYDVVVEDRYNKLLDSTYSTIVRGGVQRVRVCTDSGMTENCNEFYDKLDKKTWSKGEDLEDDTTIQIPDVPAGTRLYVRSEVYPKSSAGKDNDKDDSLDPAGECNFGDMGCWAVSETEELVVAKRPSFQVWGGGVYSAGTINLTKNVSKKMVLDGYADLGGSELPGDEDQAQGDVYYNAVDVSYVFGPWTELGLMANGSVTGLASGAGLGYAQVSDAGSAMLGSGSGVSGLGGGYNVSFCKISALSFANMNCGLYVGKLGKNGPTLDRSALLADFSNASDDEYTLIDKGGEDVQTSSIDVGNTSDYNGDWVVEDGKVKNIKRTKIIKTSGKVTINRDITYDSNDYANSGYQKIEDIPKIIIYAHDIEITCAVQRIDAVLIAENSINTCSDVDESRANTSRENSNQLVINGATISNKLILNRTYGAATGVNSIVPAEIINYDSSLYLWGSKQADMTNSGELTEASIRELAPRY